MGLANIMLLLSLQLRIPITSDTSGGAANSTSDTVCDARAEVVELALGFLGFAFSVLLGASTLEVLLMTTLVYIFCDQTQTYAIE